MAATTSSPEDHDLTSRCARFMDRHLLIPLVDFLANKGLSRKTNGVDGVAKTLLAKQVGEVPHDPELEHPEDWDRPVD